MTSGMSSLSRIGMKNTAERSLGPRYGRGIPLKLLTETSIPLLLVMDEIRLGLAPPALLKTGAMAAIALGMVAAPVAAGAAAPATATTASEQADPVGALITDLAAALGTEAEEDAETRRAERRPSRSWRQ